MTFNINLYCMGEGGINSRASQLDFCLVMVLEKGGGNRKNRVCIFETIPADTVSLKHLKRNTY